MNLVDPTTIQPAKAVKPGAPSGAYSDPAQMGQMIQQMYPQYKSFDAATLGQRWISLHTPQAAAGGGGSDLVLAPGASVTPTTPTTPDLSGLGKFATPVQQPKPQPQPVSLTPGLNALNSSMGGVNSMGQLATPMTAPVQQQQPKPKPPTPLSTFDISKVRF